MSATATVCKFSDTLARRMHRIKKMLKPVLKMVHKKSRKAPVVAAFAAAEDEVADQNAANELLEARLEKDLADAAALGGGALAVWREGRVRLETVDACLSAPSRVPTSFLTTASGALCWVRPDADIHLWQSVTQGQTPEQQAPSSVAYCC